MNAAVDLLPGRTPPDRSAAGPFAPGATRTANARRPGATEA